MRLARPEQLLGEYNRAAMTLRDVLHALETAMRPGGKGGGDGLTSSRGKERFACAEEVRFGCSHQFRDTVSRLSTAHFGLLPYFALLEFLGTIARIVTLLQEPHTAGHGHIVRQVVRALFSSLETPSMGDDGEMSGPESQRQQQPLSGRHYYRLLRVMLLLPPSESVEVVDHDARRRRSVEELCVRRLSCGAGDPTSPDCCARIREIGPARAVRVVTWCLHSAVWASSAAPASSSHFPPRGALRIPFAVGKEYTQCVLAAFAPPLTGHGDTSELSSRKDLSGEGAGREALFGVGELATLCSAIVFYEITTMSALQVLVEAAPLCAVDVGELSGHQLSCVMLAYATLKYDGDLSRHAKSSYLSCMDKSRRETNFYLLLGERAGELGERLHEDDAARVLRALVMVGVEHEGLRRSLESSMRMRGLGRRVLFG